MKTIIPYKSGTMLLFALSLWLWGCSNPLSSEKVTAEEQRSRKIDQLFAELRDAEDPYQTMMIQEKIWALWMRSSEEVNTQMAKGLEAFSKENFAKAAAYFSEVIELKPEYAEAWNKRATSYYMLGDMEAAMQDIHKTLVLESRHFGALSGLATIYLLEGREDEALKVYERIARIAPAEPHIQEQIQDLRRKIGVAMI